MDVLDEGLDESACDGAVAVVDVRRCRHGSTRRLA
jgi:hypothetical protein